jgi:hypothetical protein
MLDALAVPHPELVAGRPQSYGFNTSTGTFTLGLQHRTGQRDRDLPERLADDRCGPLDPVPGRIPGRGQWASVVSATGVLELAR